MTKIFSRFIIAFILFTWTAVPAFAQSQFSIVPFTSKTQEECKKVLDDFEMQPKIPNDSYIQKVGEANAAADDFALAMMENTEASDNLESTMMAYENQKKEFEAANPGQSCGTTAGGTCSASYDAYSKAVDTAKAKKEAYDAAKTKFDASMEGVSDNTLDVASLEGLRDSVLGCGIKTGRITLSMIPYFITYFANFLLGLAGLISVLFIVIGGYRYVIGGLTEDKEKGKQTIMHALMGFGLSLLAWAIVNIVMGAVTG